MSVYAQKAVQPCEVKDSKGGNVEIFATFGAMTPLKDSFRKASENLYKFAVEV
jgi:hypothetical protein